MRFGSLFVSITIDALPKKKRKRKKKKKNSIYYFGFDYFAKRLHFFFVLSISAESKELLLCSFLTF